MSEADSERRGEQGQCPHFGGPVCEDGKTCCRCRQQSGEWNKAFSGHGPIGGSPK